jgi:hypothetical protein
MAYKIKDWDKFQHFKDRKPPWVKLYRDILDDPDWHELDGDSAKALVAIWLIASEDETKTGTLPETRKLAFRLRVTESKVLQILNKLSNFLYQDDINMISERYQHDTPETETEAETYTEADKKQTKKIDSVTLPDWMPLDAWDGFCKMRGKTFTPHAKQLAIKTLDGFRNAGFNPREVLEQSIMNGWKGLFEPKPKGNRNENTGRNFAYRDKSAEARAAVERALGTTIFDDEERRTW